MVYDVYDADNEEPICERCDHCCDGFDCWNMCGAEHGWFGYRRTEKREVDKYEKPMLMQSSEPEYMCPICGYKFYVYDKNKRPDECKYCGVKFRWDK